MRFRVDFCHSNYVEILSLNLFLMGCNSLMINLFFLLSIFYFLSFSFSWISDYSFMRYWDNNLFFL